MYSSELAQKLLMKFQAKGWNLYKPNGKSEDTIKSGPVESLELNGIYVSLPAAENPRNPEQVFHSLEILAQKLDRKMPTIIIDQISYPLTGITLKEDSVKLHTISGFHVPYEKLIQALDSIVDTKSA